MPTALDLINAEKIASALFILADLEALASAFKAEQAELEKGQNATTSSSTGTTATIESNQLALRSTGTVALGYIIFLIVALFRKNQIEEQIQSGSINVSIMPAIIIILGFAISTLAAIMRLPAIRQRLLEAQVPVIL